MTQIDELKRPEVLAPVGDRETLYAALSAGADAVYFGLDGQFNARAKSEGISIDQLADTVQACHYAGTKVLVTLNTLIFEDELPKVAIFIQAAAEAGVDALIVQDPAVALIARALAPSLEVHASTQMTVSSPEAAQFAASLGVTRVVVPRELTLSQIERFKRETDLELEVFIHGALCMSWSGQCLTSEAWGGRSANRGQCAQSCRMPYDLIVDGEERPLGEVKYLLSPRDLSGIRAVEGLMRAGVECLKIEGRYKGPAYVSQAIHTYQGWVNRIAEGLADQSEAREQISEQLTALSLTYSRGLSDGFFGGSDHQSLVEGRFPKHRGVFLGYVIKVDQGWVEVRIDGDGRRYNRDAKGKMSDPLPIYPGAEQLALSHEQEQGPQLASLTLRSGMGVVFDNGRPEEEEQGGRVTDVERSSQGWRFRLHRLQVDETLVGQRLWVNRDERLVHLAEKEGKREAKQPTSGRLSVGMRVTGRVGQALSLTITLLDSLSRYHALQVEVQGDSDLVDQVDRPLSEMILKDKLTALGGTPFHCVEWTVELPEHCGVPVSSLKRLRRSAVSRLQELMEAHRPHRLMGDALGAIRTLSSGMDQTEGVQSKRTKLVPLCRTDEQLEAVIQCRLEEGGQIFDEVELDWMEMVGLRRAVERAREAGLKVTIATVRVQKPGEAGYDRRIASLKPDGVLIRHWGALTHFSQLDESERPVLHGDFSLNITNSIAAHYVASYGLETLTASHDLNAAQLERLMDSFPASQLAVTLHHHIPTFHTEHCVYAHLLSDGRDFRTCGRPCEAHRVALRDQKGMAHPVLVDVECRNTVFNASAQTAARLAEQLLKRSVGRLRIEFVWENREQALRVLQSYMGLYHGNLNAERVLSMIGVHERFGLTTGTMEVHR